MIAQKKSSNIKARENERHDVRPGQLVRLSSFGDDSQGPNVIKLYSDLDILKKDPFLGFNNVVVIDPGETLVTIVLSTSNYAPGHSYADLTPWVEAVQIIYEQNVWWINFYDIAEVFTEQRRMAYLSGSPRPE